MYCLTTEQSFDAAHFLKGYEGKCRNLHGHRWRVLVTISEEQLEQDGQCRGMIVDFGKLKQDLKTEADALDHCLIIEKDSLKSSTLQALLEEEFKIVTVDFRPTAEHFSKYFYDKMKQRGYHVQSVTVYETPNNCAQYRE